MNQEEEIRQVLSSEKLTRTELADRIGTISKRELDTKQKEALAKLIDKRVIRVDWDGKFYIRKEQQS